MLTMHLMWKRPVEPTSKPKTLEADAASRRQLMKRFWQIARGFWRRDGDRRAWALTGALIAILVIQLFVQYRINTWNRDIFNALEQKDAAGVFYQTLVYLPL